MGAWGLSILTVSKMNLIFMQFDFPVAPTDKQYPHLSLDSQAMSVLLRRDWWVWLGVYFFAKVNSLQS